MRLSDYVHIALAAVTLAVVAAVVAGTLASECSTRCPGASHRNDAGLCADVNGEPLIYQR